MDVNYNSQDMHLYTNFRIRGQFTGITRDKNVAEGMKGGGGGGGSKHKITNIKVKIVIKISQTSPMSREDG